MIDRLRTLPAGRRAKWVILLVWLAAAGALGPYQAKLQQATTNDPASFLPASAESTKVVETLRQRFANGRTTPALIVWRRDGGLTELDRRAISAVVTSIRKLRLDETLPPPPCDIHTRHRCCRRPDHRAGHRPDQAGGGADSLARPARPAAGPRGVRDGPGRDHRGRGRRLRRHRRHAARHNGGAGARAVAADLPLARDRARPARRRRHLVRDRGRDRLSTHPVAGSGDQRPDDRDLDHPHVRRGHRLLPPDRVAIPGGTAASRGPPRVDDRSPAAHLAGDPLERRHRHLRHARAPPRRPAHLPVGRPGVRPRHRDDDARGADAPPGRAGHRRATRVLAVHPASRGGERHRERRRVAADRRERGAAARRRPRRDNGGSRPGCDRQRGRPAWSVARQRLPRLGRVGRGPRGTRTLAAGRRGRPDRRPRRERIGEDEPLPRCGAWTASPPCAAWGRATTEISPTCR